MLHDAPSTCKHINEKAKNKKEKRGFFQNLKNKRTHESQLQILHDVSMKTNK